MPFSRLLVMTGVLLATGGCFERSKPEPLPRAGSSASAPITPVTPMTPAVIKDSDSEMKVEAPPAVPKTLYERLGQEEGIKKLASAAIVEFDRNANALSLTTKVGRNVVVEFLMDMASKSRSTQMDDLTLAEWTAFMSALDTALQSVDRSAREELLARIQKIRSPS